MFYDGYAGTVDEPVPAGVVRHSNWSNATKLTDEQLALIETTLDIGVIVGVLRDNYDRIGAVPPGPRPQGRADLHPRGGPAHRAGPVHHPVH